MQTTNYLETTEHKILKKHAIEHAAAVPVDARRGPVGFGEGEDGTNITVLANAAQY